MNEIDKIKNSLTNFKSEFEKFEISINKRIDALNVKADVFVPKNIELYSYINGCHSIINGNQMLKYNSSEKDYEIFTITKWIDSENNGKNFKLIETINLEVGKVYYCTNYNNFDCINKIYAYKIYLGEGIFVYWNDNDNDYKGFNQSYITDGNWCHYYEVV